jgi:DNA-binding transcriptional regulator PaaX
MSRKNTPTTAAAPRTTKAALLRELVGAPGGASLTRLMEATGWQAHTVRAALSGLRKQGVMLERRREATDTIYRATASNPAPRAAKGAQ